MLKIHTRKFISTFSVFNTTIILKSTSNIASKEETGKNFVALHVTKIEEYEEFKLVD